MLSLGYIYLPPKHSIARLETTENMEGVMQTKRAFSRSLQIIICALILTVLMPVFAIAQRVVVVRRPVRRSFVVYQTRPYVTYRRPRYYQSYYYNYPGYSSRYYSYRNTQPYFANPYTYSYANPTYRYYEYGYRPRHRHSRFRISFR